MTDEWGESRPAPNPHINSTSPAAHWWLLKVDFYLHRSIPLLPKQQNFQKTYRRSNYEQCHLVTLCWKTNIYQSTKLYMYRYSSIELCIIYIYIYLGIHYYLAWLSREILVVSFDIAFAIPKSISFNLPCTITKFAGFKSLCTTLRREKRPTGGGGQGTGDGHGTEQKEIRHVKYTASHTWKHSSTFRVLRYSMSIRQELYRLVKIQHKTTW